MKTICSQCSM